ncbi:Bdr family repetitive protein [Borreliella valaisiana]|uniref:Bdr family repetitive protein n=1 Tax=Borreliella valaisiana TaxID=62088 RepID=UPI001AEEF704|nr:Bdr family repetitive protein [Borreliella valaisiana]
MNNLAYRTYNIENIRNEFLNIGFSEEAIDFVFLHNDNYNFEFLKEKIINTEKNLRKDISNLDVKIDNVEKSLQKDISNLNTKIDNVKSELTNKIENEVKDLRKDLNMGNRMVHFMILTAVIIGPILNALFMKYLQFIK